MPANILLITDDQHRWDFVGGGTVACLRTPAIDRLRAEGTTLVRAYSNCPICMPTRFTWLYGLYASQGRARLLRNAHDWPTNLPSMAHALQRRGYHTALVGKLHSLAGLCKRDVCAHLEETRQRGFDDVLEVSGKTLSYWYDCAWTRYLDGRNLLSRYRNDLHRRNECFGQMGTYEPTFLATGDSMDGFIGARAREWLRAYDGGQPFFLHASFCGPHFPIDPPREYFERYVPDDMPVPKRVDDAADVRAWQERRAAYCAMIAHIDDEVAALLSVLEERGESDNTLVVFTTDHGDMMGHRGLHHKGKPYETATRTPVTLRLPGTIPAGAVLDDMVEAVDLPCTLLDAAGCEGGMDEYLPNTPGRSYWRYARGKTDTHRQWAYSECGTGESAWRMVVERDWKLITRASGEDELYNLAGDPWELKNLAALPEHRDRVLRLQRELLGSMMHCLAPDTVDCGPVDMWWEREPAFAGSRESRD